MRRIHKHCGAAAVATIVNASRTESSSSSVPPTATTQTGGSSAAAPSSSSPSPASSSAWRQQVLDRETQEELGLASDKTYASGAILSEKEYDESRRRLGGGKLASSSSSASGAGSSSSSGTSASATASARGGKGRGGNSAAEAEAAMLEGAESATFSPVDFYRRRLSYLFLVRFRRMWAPVAAYIAALYGIGTANLYLSPAAAAAAAATADGGATAAVSVLSLLSMPQIMSAAAAVALLNRFVVAGPSSRWLRKARLAAKAARAEVPSAAPTGASSSASAAVASRLPLYRQIAVVTGATGALGREVAAELQALGAMVIVTHLPGSRPLFAADASSAKEGAAAPPPSPNAVITQTNAPAGTIPMRSYPLDLADRNSVRAFCGLIGNDRSHTNAPNPLAVPKIDLLVLAAGIKEQRYVPTRYNTDRHIEVNFLGHFLLAENLLPLLRRSQYSGVDASGRGAGAATATSSAASPSSPTVNASSSSATFAGVRGGRVVYVSCVDHSSVGQKVQFRSIANAYFESSGSSSSAFSGSSTYKEKFLREGDDSYLVGPMYATSKVGTIVHTMSLHERRYAGVDGTAATGGLLGGGGSAAASSGASSGAFRSQPPLRPYVAMCAVLPSFQSFLGRSKLDEEALPAAVVEARLAAGFTKEGALANAAEAASSSASSATEKKKPSVAAPPPPSWAMGGASSASAGGNSTAFASASSSVQQGVIPQIGSNSAAVSDEAAVQAFDGAASLLGSLWRQTPRQAAETVLDVCLRPDACSGGMYSETIEMSHARRASDSSAEGTSLLSRLIPRPAALFEVLSAACHQLRARQSLIGWAAQQTRGYTVDIPPHAQQQQAPSAAAKRSTAAADRGKK